MLTAFNYAVIHTWIQYGISCWEAEAKTSLKPLYSTQYFYIGIVKKCNVTKRQTSLEDREGKGKDKGRAWGEVFQGLRLGGNSTIQHFCHLVSNSLLVETIQRTLKHVQFHFSSFVPNPCFSASIVVGQGVRKTLSFSTPTEINVITQVGWSGRPGNIPLPRDYMTEQILENVHRHRSIVVCISILLQKCVSSCLQALRFYLIFSSNLVKMWTYCEPYVILKISASILIAIILKRL